MEAEGLDVDLERRQELINTYRDNAVRIHAENIGLLGEDYNPRSYTKDIPHIVTKLLKLPPRKGYGLEELTALIGNHTEVGSIQYKVLRNILDERQILTNFNYLEASPDADGRMRSSWNIVGTETEEARQAILVHLLDPLMKNRIKLDLHSRLSQSMDLSLKQLEVSLLLLPDTFSSKEISLKPKLG